MAKFKYTIFDKASFYLSYFWYKLILPFEVKTPKFSLWWYEFKYSIAKFKRYEISIPWNSPKDYVENIFGKFNIRPGTSDAANVSPAFERRDINYMLQLMKKLTSAGRKVLFLDIGGDLGSYSVIVANRFPDIDINCFEPVEKSHEMINGNIKLNKIGDNFKLHPYALFSEDNDDAEMKMDIGTPGSSSMKNESFENTEVIKIKTRKMDSLLMEFVGKYGAVVCKIDVEGVEKEVVEGGKLFLSSFNDVYIMVEDFVNPEIISYLESNGWDFTKKVTSYNSWWHKSQSNG